MCTDCDMENRRKLFFVRDHPRCKKAGQIKQATEFGCDDPFGENDSEEDDSEEEDDGFW